MALSLLRNGVEIELVSETYELPSIVVALRRMRRLAAADLALGKPTPEPMEIRRGGVLLARTLQAPVPR